MTRADWPKMEMDDDAGEYDDGADAVLTLAAARPSDATTLLAPKDQTKDCDHHH